MNLGMLLGVKFSLAGGLYLAIVDVDMDDAVKDPSSPTQMKWDNRGFTGASQAVGSQFSWYSWYSVVQSSTSDPGLDKYPELLGPRLVSWGQAGTRGARPATPPSLKSLAARLRILAHDR